MRRAIAHLTAVAALLTLLLAVLSVAAPVGAQVGQSARLYIPLLNRPALVELSAGASADPETMHITQPATLLTAGTTRIYVNARMIVPLNSAYRVEVHTPGGSMLTLAKGMIYRPEQIEGGAICRAYFGCAGSTLPLPSGPYQIHLFLDDRLTRTLTVTIAP